MKRILVVEGRTDEVIVNWLVQGLSEPVNVGIRQAGGRDAAPALARTLLFKVGAQQEYSSRLPRLMISRR